MCWNTVTDLKYFPQICKGLKKITKLLSEYPIYRLRWAQDHQNTKEECYTLDCNIQSPMFLAIALDTDCHAYIPATLPTIIVVNLSFTQVIWLQVSDTERTLYLLLGI